MTDYSVNMESYGWQTITAVLVQDTRKSKLATHHVMQTNGERLISLWNEQLIGMKYESQVPFSEKDILYFDGTGQIRRHPSIFSGYQR